MNELINYERGECEHGGLKSKCEICNLTEELADMTAHRDSETRWVAQYKQERDEANHELSCIGELVDDFKTDAASTFQDTVFARVKCCYDLFLEARKERDEALTLAEVRREAMSRMHDEMNKQAARANRNADQRDKATERIEELDGYADRLRAERDEYKAALELITPNANMTGGEPAGKNV